MSDIYQFNVGGTTYNLANLGLLAPVQITLTADRLYNTGDQFIYTGLLYEATETIAQGTSITIGSNAQLADCVTKQISEINSNLTVTVDTISPKVSVYKYGKIRLVIINSLTLSNTDVIQLGDDNHPAFFVATFVIDSVGNAVRVSVRTNGELFFANSQGTPVAGSSVVATLCYVVN